MKLALLLSLLAGQTIYEWIDSKGESHFTDNPSTIPRDAKRRTTEGAELMVASPTAAAGPRPDGGVPRAVPKAPPPAPVTPGASGPDSCVRVREQISQLERQQEALKTDFAQVQERENLQCQEVLRLSGQPDFARCMASRSKAPSPGQGAWLQKQLEAAQESLRRAQQDGCR